MENPMPDEPTPTLPAQNAEPPAKSPEQQAAPGDATTKPEQTEETWDPERAKRTIENLRAVEKQAKKDAKELAELKAEKQKQAEAEMTEAQRLAKQADELKAENARLQADLLRREVIAETGLPSELADRLRGATKEELLADAEKLKALLPQQPNKPTPPTLGATNPADGQQVKDLATLRAQRDRREANPFEVNVARNLGGGVIVPKE
jgi:hypothetical protein